MVNKVTPALFKKAADPESMAALKVKSAPTRQCVRCEIYKVEDIYECIQRVSLAPTKARHISQLSEVRDEGTSHSSELCETR